MQIAQNIDAPVTIAFVARRWLAPGLTAGAAFLAIEVLAGALSSTAWSFPATIARTIGVGSPSVDLDLTQLLVGIAIHSTFSVGMGILFIAIAERFGLHGRQLLAGGVLFTWAESAVSIWLVLNTLFPTTLPLLLGAVPFWASFVGRTGFGVMLALVYQHTWHNAQ